ncbi:WecB/TagA/CpsF family glycosyltransferase [Patescibacteria group bacterium]|nr:WecB/TagA/CpsF family glycosyltransferase [Patescibacteria group bacterium]
MKILGVKIDNLSLNEVLDKVEGFLGDNNSHYIVTPNPEFLVKAQKDEEFKKILNQADLSIPDGVGLVLASLLSGERIKERIAGVDLMEAICERAAEKNWPVFLFGAGEGVAEKAGDNLKGKYEGLEVKVYRPCLGVIPAKAGIQTYTFSNSWIPNQVGDDTGVGDDTLSSSILFVALGAPKQEKWINENLKKMPSVKLAIGVGGAFDFISGNVKRAPKFIRDLGLEWLWRLMIQPWRIKRIFNAVVVFPLLVLKSKLMYN